MDRVARGRLEALLKMLLEKNITSSPDLVMDQALAYFGFTNRPIKGMLHWLKKLEQIQF